MTRGEAPRPYAWSVAALYAWLRCHPRLVDSVLAAALGFAGVGSAIASGRYLLLPVALGLCLPIVFRRAHPSGAFAVAVAVGALQVALGIRVNMLNVTIVVLLYTPGRLPAAPAVRSRPGRLPARLGGRDGPLADPPATSLLNWLILGSIAFAGSSLIAWVLGDSMRYRRGYYAALEDRAARLEAERDAQAQIAAAAERARIARELHDVIAHHVSVMVVQADGASYALDRSTRTGPARRWPPSRAPAGRPWPRCAACSACCAATTAPRAWSRCPA